MKKFGTIRLTSGSGLITSPNTYKKKKKVKQIQSRKTGKSMRFYCYS